MVEAIEQSKNMATRGSLDPDARAFVPGSRNLRSDPYYDEPQWQSREYERHLFDYDSQRYDDRYFNDDHNYPRFDMNDTAQSGFPSSQELRDFYQELQNGDWDREARIPKSRRSPPPRRSPPAQQPPPKTVQRSPVPAPHLSSGGTARLSARHPADRRTSPPPRQKRRERTPPHSSNRGGGAQQVQERRRSPPKNQQKQQRPSPSFANVARSSLERKSAHSNTPSPTVESRTKIEATGGLNAPDSRERQSSPNSAERTKHSPPKIDVSYDADAEVNLIRSQLEFYFSDKNLLEESNSNLIFYMLQGKMWVPLHVVCALPKIRDLGGKKEDVLNALRTSTLLELNAAENKVRRPEYQLPPDFKVRKSLRRSVLVYGLPQQMTDAGVRSLLEMHGNILCVAFPNQTDGPDIEMGRIIMKKKLGDPSNLLLLTCAFVVFESQSQANKCVKARSRSSSDGIKTMHKYDYNKVAKRLGKGMSPNASPLWTPTASPSFNSEPRSSSLSGATPTMNAVPGGLKLSPAHNAHHAGSPHFGGSRSMSRSPVVRSMNSRSPFYRSQRSPSWKLEENGEISGLRQRSSSMQNRRVIVAKGPDNTKGFRWPRNPQWKSTRTTLDVLNTTMV